MPNMQTLIDITRKAGEIIMHHYRQESIEVKYKADSSPVSTADLESNQLICKELDRLYPDIAIISEENDNPPITKDLFWSIDPLDGTKSFLNRSGEFTVNIALIKGTTPILGIVYAPLSDALYYVDIDNIPYKQSKDGKITQIKARSIPKEGSTVIVSKTSVNGPKLQEFLKHQQVHEIITCSSALKICLVAEGSADLYPRLGQTMEWDTAAGHAILNAAGGSICSLNNEELTYGNKALDYCNPEFIASGRKD
jgi:3'(2'), 5'-bisphosphate nucleotidase